MRTEDTAGGNPIGPACILALAISCFRRLSLPLLGFWSILSPPSASSQSPDTLLILPGIVCEACKISVDTVAILGSEGGEGFVDRTNEIAAGEKYFYVVHRVAATDIRVFRKDGTFFRTVGREGEGPGEFRKIVEISITRGDTLHIIDRGNLRRTIISPELETLETSRLPGTPYYGGYEVLEDGGSVLTAIAPDSLGELRLLHRLDRNGDRIRSFGPPLAGANQFNTVQTSFIRMLALTKSEDILVAPSNRFLIEVYQTAGDPKSVYRFTERDWTEMVPGGGAFPGYNPRIQDIWVDNEARLWVLMRIGDPDWERAIEVSGPTFRGRPGTTLVDYDGFWDTMVEVIDLESMEVLARRRFDSNFLRFLGSNEVSGFGYLENGAYRLPIYRISLETGIDRISH